MASKYRKPLSWTAIFILSLPALALYAYSLRHPGIPGKNDRFMIAVGNVAPATNSGWTLLDSGTTAGLRGIYSVDGKIAWASGTGGTVLRTVDGGEHWTKCAVPDGDKDGATLDFRGVQAWDAKTAIVMASGPGDKSRLYKTVDGCGSWSLLYTNPDKDGFWDAIQFDDKQYGMLLGDPVHGRFRVFITLDNGNHWSPQESPGLIADEHKDGIFAASNTSLIAYTMLAHRYFITGGTDGAKFVECNGHLEIGGKPYDVDCLISHQRLPLGSRTQSSGAFSLGFSHSAFVAVGGDYAKPNDPTGTAAYSTDAGKTWTASTTPPHGYRSSVQWSEELKAWITVGTNGSDISRDDGKTWAPLDDPIMRDGNWNALSLPFVVGPKGQIARLGSAPR